MSDSCPVCGGGYIYGPAGRSHASCREVQVVRAEMDKAVVWLLSDDPGRGPEPKLITRLRDVL